MRIAAVLLLAVLVAPAVRADTSPYAGEQGRTIKALSPGEIDDLRTGRGMGLAKAAELNGFPGPMHVLELADRLGLSAEQRSATHALVARMKADAQRLGADIIAAEQALDRAFADRGIDDGALQAKLAEIARLQGELRYVHLRTHLAQAALMTPEQRRQYDMLRGYAEGGATPQHGHGTPKH
jgi:Spy/CpxP family protein refolding chaperone